MAISRRSFIGAAFGFASDIVFNKRKVTNSLLEELAVGNADAAEVNQQKTKSASNGGIESTIANLTHDQMIFDINRGLKEIKWGKDQKGYDDAFAHFTSIYDKSIAKYDGKYW